MRHALKFAGLLLVFPLLVTAQTVYRWVDKDGKIHYGDSPPAENKSVQQKNLKGGTASAGEVPFAVKDASQRNPVTAFITGCGAACDSARALLAKRGVPYTLKDPEKNPNDADALTKLAGGLDVPFLQVGDRSIRGFAEESWNGALDAGGYPRVNPFTKAPEPKKSEMPKDREFEKPDKDGKLPSEKAGATPVKAAGDSPAKAAPGK